MIDKTRDEIIDWVIPTVCDIYHTPVESLHLDGNKEYPVKARKLISYFLSELGIPRILYFKRLGYTGNGPGAQIAAKTFKISLDHDYYAKEALDKLTQWYQLWKNPDKHNYYKAKSIEVLTHLGEYSTYGTKESIDSFIKNVLI